jgi:pSer/pThr/pTyr-binding forkhead associated (FHA) protein
MARFEFTTPSGTSSYEITDEFVTIGTDAGNHLRLHDPAVAPVHLRLIHVQNGYRLELANAEQKLKVNGEECVARALKPNDRIQIGDSTLTFVDERASSPPLQQAQPQRSPRATAPQATAPQKAHATAPQQARRAAPAAAGHSAGAHRAAGHASGQHGGHHAGHHAAEHHAGGHHGHHTRKEKKPAWINWVVWGTLSFVALLIVLRLLGAGEYYREQGSPQHWLEEATKQLEQGDFSRALDSCQSADMLKPDAETLKQIQELREKITARIARDKDQSNLTLAKNSLQAMEEFEKTHLGIEQPRPAARELARNAQLWLKNYSETVRRYPDTAQDVAKVQSLFNRFAPIAQLDKPDDADDVLFAVDRRMSLSPPLYFQAMRAIDDYLSAHPNDKRAPKLRERRDGIVKTARVEYDRNEAEARRHLSSRSFAEARRALQAMREAIVDDAWVRNADALERDIAAGEKGK